MPRRKSDAVKTVKVCDYHAAFRHEARNQITHQQRQQADPEHDPWSPCWCCCTDCGDLTWFYKPRKGVWWQRTASGELRMMGETSAGSPGSPETSPS